MKQRRWQKVPSDLRLILQKYNLDRDSYDLFLEILISQHGNMVGVFQCPDLYLCADLSWKMEDLKKAMTNLTDLKLVEKGEFHNLIMLNPALGLNPIESFITPQQVIAAVKVLNDLPHGKIYRSLVKHLLTLNKPSIKPVIRKLNSMCGLRDND